MYLNAFFRNSYFNTWRGNYWDDWIGISRPLLKFMPNRIPGRLFDFLPNILPMQFEDLFHSRLTIRANYDWFPAKEPYDL